MQRSSASAGRSEDAPLPVSESSTPTARQRLSRVIAARCQGTTALVSEADPELAEALAAHRVAFCTTNAETGSRRFDTVVVAHVLERLSERAARDLLARAWQLLSPEGRLLVCVANEDLGSDPDQIQWFTRRKLRRLLRSFGRPKLVTSQPLQWLVMVVEARPPVSRGVRERYRIIAERCRGRVIELGCGPGELAGTIADRGLPVTGVDKNEQKIALARRCHPRVEFRSADIAQLPIEPRYDTVVLSEVLEHVPEDVGARFLQTARELLAPGGRLIVSVPNEDCVPHRNHVREFTRRDLEQLLQPLGEPRLVTDQPFRYLLMVVDRDRDA